MGAVREVGSEACIDVPCIVGDEGRYGRLKEHLARRVMSLVKNENKVMKITDQPECDAASVGMVRRLGAYSYFSLYSYGLPRGPTAWTEPLSKV